MSKEEMREGFEAWHCEQYKTKHCTGAPTRDMHNGVRAEKYGPPKQQALWEFWQETGGDVAKVEALKDQIEQKEAGKQPVAWFRSDALGCVMWKPRASLALKEGDPLYTRSDAGEVERLRKALKLAAHWCDSALNATQRGDDAPQSLGDIACLLRHQAKDIEAALSASAEPTVLVATQYRLLEDGEIIEKDDQFIEDDAATWSPVSPRAPIFVGMPYARKGMKAVRRVVADSAEPTNKDADQ
jgi:hypothetical protein